jgi:hypothetical protein
MKSKQERIPAKLKGYIVAFVIESLCDHDVCIYGDPEGLRSLGNALIAIADLDQKLLPDQQCPPDDSFHTHYAINLNVAKSERDRAYRLTVGRVDEKASGRFRGVFPAKVRRRRRK